MKVLFDTNVYTSAVIRGGAIQETIAACMAARWNIAVSTYVMDELQRTLARLGLP